MKQFLYKSSLPEQQESTDKLQGNPSSNSPVKRVIGKRVIVCSGQVMNAPRADYLLPFGKTCFASRAVLRVNECNKVAENIGKAWLQNGIFTPL